MNVIDTPEPKHKPSAYDWVAAVARLLPEATFAPGQRVRDGKIRVNVTNNTVTVEAVVGDDEPADVVKLLKPDDAPCPPQ